MFKTEKQFDCIGLDPTNNEGIHQILQDWTQFKSRKHGIRPGYYDLAGLSKLLKKHQANPEVIECIADTMVA